MYGDSVVAEFEARIGGLKVGGGLIDSLGFVG